MTRPLDGIKVVEVSRWAFVPSAAMVLAEWGAEVVKIEPPNGDPMRGLSHMGLQGVDGINFLWEAFNRGKRDIVLDLNLPEAQEIVQRLCVDADVFMTSYFPPAREALGISLEAIRARNPTIVYASGSGHGVEGPDALKGGFDGITFWGRGGMAAAAAPLGSPQPARMPSGGFGDSLSGMALAGGVAAALLKQARTGEGSVVDVSLLGTAAWCMQVATSNAAATLRRSPETAETPENPPPVRPLDGAAMRAPVFNPLAYSYETGDHRWLTLSMLQSDRYFEGAMRALGRADLAERFPTPESRAGRNEEIAALLRETFVGLTLQEACAALSSQSGQWEAVNRPVDLLDDPQARLNGFIQDVDYGDGVTFPLSAAPAQFDRTPAHLVRAPEFGEHTDEILASIDMDEEAILQAKISGAVI
jgi:crotonobetainyl-CoA:carnitine CoA-transferase CaiB-like acyl-CoA transferase